MRFAADGHRPRQHGQGRRIQMTRLGSLRTLARSFIAMVLVASAASILPAATVNAVPAPGSAVGPVDSANGFATWYQGRSGDRVELCLDGGDPNCVLPGVVPGFDPSQPTVFPTNFPDEAFYTLAESQIQVPPTCGNGTGKVFIALGLEAAFANGGVAAGDQMSFGRIRATGTGLCKNTTYRFVHPFGEMSAQTDSKGTLRRNETTSDVGCVPAPTQPCDWSAALGSPVANGWLRWDTGAPPGYLGDFAVAHTVTGGTYTPPGELAPTNSLRVYSGSQTTPIVQTSLWNVAGKLAGPIVAAPVFVDFGGQTEGTTSSPLTVTLTNLDQAAVTVTAATIANPAFAIDNNTCGAALPRDATCQISLRFTPSVIGVQSTTLVVTHDGVRSPLNIPVTGTGTEAGAVATATPAPTSLDFGSQRVGVLSSTKQVTLTAGGNTPLQVTNITTQGDATNDFVVVNENCVGAVVLSGSTCTIDVAAKTTALLARSAELKIDSNATPAPTLVGLAANGIGGVAAVSSDIIPEIGYPSWYQDENGVRLAPCYSGSDPLCILPGATPPFFDPAIATDINADPMNMPDEFFYTLADSALLSTPGCPTADPPIAPGKAFIRMGLEGAFSNGDPAIGEQIVFGRIRAFADGLCPNTQYSFTNPYGVETFTSDDAGFITRVAGTQDIGCFPAAGATCDWTLPIQSRVLSGFLRWDPNVAPAAPAGYTGDSVSPHRIVGGSYTPAGAAAPVDYLRLEQLGGPAPVLIGESNMWTIAGKFAGPVIAEPASLTFPDTAVGVTSPTANADVVNLGVAPV